MAASDCWIGEVGRRRLPRAVVHHARVERRRGHAPRQRAGDRHGVDQDGVRVAQPGQGEAADRHRLHQGEGDRATSRGPGSGSGSRPGARRRTSRRARDPQQQADLFEDFPRSTSNGLNGGRPVLSRAVEQDNQHPGPGRDGRKKREMPLRSFPAALRPGLRLAERQGRNEGEGEESGHRQDRRGPAEAVEERSASGRRPRSARGSSPTWTPLPGPRSPVLEDADGKAVRRDILGRGQQHEDRPGDDQGENRARRSRNAIATTVRTERVWSGGIQDGSAPAGGCRTGPPGAPEKFDKPGEGNGRKHADPGERKALSA